MKIFLIDDNQRFTNDFLNYLQVELRDYFFNVVDYKKLLPFEIYINELPRYKSLFKKYITSYEICNSALYNIKILSTKNSHTLTIDDKAILPGTSIKVLEICTLINDGNLILKAYPIFTKSFHYIQSNVERLYAEYVLGEKRNVHKTL